MKENKGNCRLLKFGRFGADIFLKTTKRYTYQILRHLTIKQQTVLIAERVNIESQSIVKTSCWYVQFNGV